MYVQRAPFIPQGASDRERLNISCASVYRDLGFMKTQIPRKSGNGRLRKRHGALVDLDVRRLVEAATKAVQGLAQRIGEPVA